MMDETGLRLFSFHRHEKGFNDEVFSNSRSQGIAYNLAIEEILMGSTVKPTLVCRDIGDITNPDLIGATNRKHLIEKVICYRQCMLRVCGVRELPCKNLSQY